MIAPIGTQQSDLENERRSFEQLCVGAVGFRRARPVRPPCHGVLDPLLHVDAAGARIERVRRLGHQHEGEVLAAAQGDLPADRSRVGIDAEWTIRAEDDRVVAHDRRPGT